LTVITAGTVICGRATIDEEAEALVFGTPAVLIEGKLITHPRDVFVPLVEIDVWHVGSFEMSYIGDPKARKFTL
jgi:hypothetical protein